ncbi:phosphotransferase [Amycolatopsis alkalitolerans]|uniref:Phosphotransferase n=1 Tax=Amycolatopsis alkalitolerans TaxID=2547244 RepID=A0A5C4M3I5_9PSEU|nr:phosphotransferase [Amycolatopsis alkalitolerans]TNC27014.1 phosphotransferase [Amycolatopsis alkalitolerans]
MTVDTSKHNTAGTAAAEEPAVTAAVAAGEVVLAHRFGSTIALVDPEHLPGSGPATVVRARIATSPFGLPRTLVIKHYPDPAPRGAPDPFAQEAVSYQLFTALPPEERMCPELLAHDGAERVLVIDDLGKAPTLRDTLLGRDARAAERSLLSWARSLGRMHATTASREADFDALLRRLGGPVKHEDTAAPTAIAQLPGLIREHFGVATPDAVRRYAEAACQRARSLAYRAFSPVDLSPDNNLITGGGVRFLDFERGRVRNALVDAAHLRVPFATCAEPLALPAGMSEAMVAAWRSEVVGVWPGLSDGDVLFAHLLDHQLLLVWVSTWTVLAGRSEKPAALVTWWRNLGAEAARAGEDAVAAHAREVTAALDEHYGPGLELPLYPAFR